MDLLACVTNVQHGFQSWVDYSKPLLLRRRFTVTEEQSQIISNLLAVVLTLVGPRLWILIRALAIWGSKRLYRSRFKSKFESSTTSGDSNNAEVPLLEQNLQAMANSENELAAAMRLLRSAARETRNGNDQLSDYIQTIEEKQSRVAQRPKNRISFVANKALDALFSVAFSVALIGLFVAQTIGAIFSSRIIEPDHTVHVITDSPGCEYVPSYRANNLFLGGEPRDYCHSVADRLAWDTRGEEVIYYDNASCPFTDGVCEGTIIGARSGKINMTELGINTPGDYSIEMAATCSTIGLDRTFDVPVKESNFTMTSLLPGTFRSCGSPDHTTYRDGNPGDPFYWLLSWKQPQAERLTWEACPQILSDGERDKATPLSSIVTVATLRHAPNVATNLTGSALWATKGFACYHQASFCTDGEHCRPIDRAFKSETLKKIQRENLLPRDEIVKPSRLVETLLRVVSAQYNVESYLGGILSNASRIDGPENNLDDNFSEQMLKGYLKSSLVEYRKTIPNILTELARNSSAANFTQTTNSSLVLIPPAYREMCKMIKTDAYGWRNIAAFPYAGLLGLAACIAVGSTTMQDGRLFAAVAPTMAWTGLKWAKSHGPGAFLRSIALFLLFTTTLCWKALAYYRSLSGYRRVHSS